MSKLEQLIIKNYLNIMDIFKATLNSSKFFIIIRDKDRNIIYPKDIFILNKTDWILNNSEYYYDEFSECKNLIEIYDRKNNEYYEVMNEKYIHPDTDEVYEIQIIKNISKQKHFELLSKLDSITGIYNNRAIMEKLDNCIMNQNHSLESFAFIICDIDDFKTINDTFTHIGGDLVLKKISDILSENLKDNGFVGRYGGDEFVIIIKNNNEEQIQRQIKMIIEQIKNIYINYQNNAIQNIMMSFGGTIIKNQNLNFTNLKDIEFYQKSIFEIADQALYESKRNGKNQLIVKEFTNL